MHIDYFRAFYFFSGVVACLLFSMPWLCNWNILNSAMNTNVEGALDNDNFRYSIISSIAAMIPLLLDKMNDILSGTSISLSRVILLFCIILPNLVLLNVNLESKVIFIAFQIRYLIFLCVCYVQLCSIGGSLFRQKRFIIIPELSEIILVLFTWASFNSPVTCNILQIFVWIGIIGSSLIFTGLMILWFKKKSKLSIGEITNNDRICAVYLCSIEFLHIALVIMLSIYGPSIGNYDMISYLTASNYISTAFILFFWFLYGGIIRLDIKTAKVL